MENPNTHINSDKLKVRCAIYTRSAVFSRDDSLSRQQHLTIQQHITNEHIDNWVVLLPQYYDDNGYSGNTLERPALQRLLDDIQNKKVDCVMVDRIYRLTRSLVDLKTLISLFKQHHVNFVIADESLKPQPDKEKIYEQLCRIIP